jgi:hypothetical protein
VVEPTALLSAWVFLVFMIKCRAPAVVLEKMVTVGLSFSCRYSSEIHTELLGAQESIRILKKEVAEKESEVMVYSITIYSLLFQKGAFIPYVNGLVFRPIAICSITVIQILVVSLCNVFSF